jgi:hypothetical protein
MGLSPQDLRRIFREGLRRWADEKEKPAGWLPEDWQSKIDPGLLDHTTDVAWGLALDTNASDEALATARAALEPMIARGLVRREHRFLRAPAIVKPEMLLDWVLWTSLRPERELRSRGSRHARRLRRRPSDSLGRADRDLLVLPRVQAERRSGHGLRSQLRKSCRPTRRRFSRWVDVAARTVNATISGNGFAGGHCAPRGHPSRRLFGCELDSTVRD